MASLLVLPQGRLLNLDCVTEVRIVGDSCAAWLTDGRVVDLDPTEAAALLAVISPTHLASQGKSGR